MAVFDNLENEYLVWTLMQNGSITMYHHAAFLKEDINQLRKDGYLINTIDCSKVVNKIDLLQQFEHELDFPDWWGRNLDALNDLIGDIYVPRDTGRVIVLNRIDHLFVYAPDLTWHILDILEHNSRSFLLFGKRLITLVQSDVPDVIVKAVGANPVSLSRKDQLKMRKSK